MTEYLSKPFDLIYNKEYRYFKLYVDNKCQFDEFCKQIKDKIEESKNLHSIMSLMEELEDCNLLPSTKFRKIKINRNDVFEFKKKTLRVYVIKQKPIIYIVMGGFKKNQNKDISRLSKRIKDFKKTSRDDE